MPSIKNIESGQISIKLCSYVFEFNTNSFEDTYFRSKLIPFENRISSKKLTNEIHKIIEFTKLQKTVNFIMKIKRVTLKSFL